MSLEQHTDTDRPAHEVAKSKLRRTLLSECIGREQAKSGKALAAETPVSSSTIRDLIGELRREEQIPVYSLGQGYFVIASSEDFEACISRIDDEIQTRQETKRQLYEAVTEQ
jgi:DNA-binding GntR family transcriptional regulator